MFNVRIKRFLNTEQVQIFSEPIRQNFDDRHINFFTGEILGVGEVLNNPFTGQLQAFKHFGDYEQNLQRSVRRTKNKIYDIARSNEWQWFFTLTFDPVKVDSFDYNLCVKKLSQWLNNMRKKCPYMLYLVVPELHKSGRYHFHGLFSNCSEMDFADSGKRDKQGRIIFNVSSYKLGFSTATSISDLRKVCSYIGKYITKDLCALTSGRKRYWASRNVKLPQVHDFYVGLSEKEILKACNLDVAYIKKICTSFSDVLYVDVPIHSTNMRVFDVHSLSRE